ncbi:SPOR domain-containing protein [Aliivibrio sifiae]|uniref:SPOR domain-containing protein n=1 Tax=Aliivibrio sifiae TaxID=566293 RepID=A0A2S7X1H3_9GAMM|nr:SPOR domain-containing protein [Aliivibrio sifiae]PQJ83849.1 hypothetical protein BTO23_20345 [Aliivibrio sifiae]GLR76494.1 hypothetical protein GCM10007855_33690 [Aliivibrio sifiae]
MAKLKKRITISLGILSTLAAVTNVYANENTVDYLATNNSVLASVCFPKETKSANNELLDSCPIGEGLWGNQPAKYDEGDSEFWIQCGLFRKALSDNIVSQISSAVNVPINMKKEEKLNRCLIGPYSDFLTAKKALKTLQKERLFSKSALREVDISSMPKAEITSETIAEPELNPVTIRKGVSINQINFAVPFIDNGSEGFYMENKIPWLRATSQYAQEVCQKIEMDLVTKEQWQILIDSTIMIKDKWPMQLPYWGADDLGLFKDGAVRKLKNTSMLNVVCTKKVEDKVVGNPI